MSFRALALFVVLAAGCSRSEVSLAAIECHVDADCNSEGACTIGLCRAGVCSIHQAPDTTQCNDGRFCTENDRCSAGVCSGGPRNCDALTTSCTLGTCNEGQRSCLAVAQHTPDPEGPKGIATCDDNLDNDCDGATDAADLDCASSNWWNTAYQFRTKIHIDTRAIGTALNNFPVVVRVSNAELGAAANTGKRRFIDSDGITELPFEQENANGVNIYWVRVRNLLPVSEQTFIWLYLGNVTVADLDATTVWDADYGAVWHFDDASPESVVADSTVNANNGAGFGLTSSSRTTGIVGAGFAFNSAYVRVPSSAQNNLALPGNYTLEAWADGTASDGPDVMYFDLIGRQLGSDRRDAYVLAAYQKGATYKPTFVEEDAFALDATSVMPGPRVYAAVADATTLTLYVNGEVAAVADRNLQTPRDDNDVLIGAQENHSTSEADEFWPGVIDEPRISTSARSADWMRASSINLGGTWLSIDPIEALF